MKQKTIQITGEPIGEGQERICYRHPDDPGKIIKLQKGSSNKQTRRELELYRRLARRKATDYSQLPRYYGKVTTNLGEGFVTDLIVDYDGEVSNSLYWYFERGYPVEEFYPYLDELKQYLLANQVVFSEDLRRTNVLFQRLSPDRAQLVVIDGLGNHSAINWFDVFRSVSDSKINRRWQRFMRQLKIHSDEMIAAGGVSPRPLAAAYRRTG
ncbi:MAG: YrbL family protein [Gammaproteobacteria bacterium]|nr:YrbL family protein [Gammaproteobacteria bacterium]